MSGPLGNPRLDAKPQKPQPSRHDNRQPGKLSITLKKSAQEHRQQPMRHEYVQRRRTGFFHKSHLTERPGRFYVPLRKYFLVFHGNIQHRQGYLDYNYNSVRALRDSGFNMFQIRSPAFFFYTPVVNSAPTGKSSGTGPQWVVR